LDTNVGADLESLDLVDLEALDLVDLEALDTSVALVALEPIGLNIVHKEVKTGVSIVVFSVSRHQGFKGVITVLTFGFLFWIRRRLGSICIRQCFGILRSFGSIRNLGSIRSL